MRFVRGQSVPALLRTCPSGGTRRRVHLTRVCRKRHAGSIPASGTASAVLSLDSASLSWYSPITCQVYWAAQAAYEKPPAEPLRSAGVLRFVVESSTRRLMRASQTCFAGATLPTGCRGS